MKKIDAWLLTEGAHGMISQVEGLAKALDANFEHKKIIYNSFWSLFPPMLTPKNKKIFNFDQIVNINEKIKKPNFLISCGRKSVIPSILLKRFFQKNNNINNIHIQDPKINISEFDFIIVPDHDSLNGENIIKSQGAIHYISREEIEEKRKDKNSKNILSIILGGPNKYYAFLADEIKILFNKIDYLFFKDFDEVRIVTSRRTPNQIVNFLNLKYKDNKKIIIDSSLSRKNYVEALALSKKIIITSDSISMISESAVTGTPIYLARLKSKKNDYRFIKFLDLFTKLNIIKDLDTSEQHWTYDKLYETKRIAEIIKNKILKIV